MKRVLMYSTLVCMVTTRHAWADFALSETTQFVQDQAPFFLFELISSLLLVISQLFFGDLFGVTTA